MVNIADSDVASISIEEVSSYSHPAVITFDMTLYEKAMFDARPNLKQNLVNFML